MKKTLFSSAFLFIWLFSFAQFNTIFHFNNSTSGESPNGYLFSDGTFLYGTTYQGGIYDLGTLYKIMPDGTGYLKLMDFSGPDGSHPNDDFVYDGSFLYGMTSAGGVNDMGTIYKIMPNGTGYLKLIDFDGVSNGRRPLRSLSSDGTFLYGTTANGGTSDMGTIFKIMPDGTGFLKLLDFTGTNGRAPWCKLVSDGTFLYGTTTNGGTNDIGTIFKIMPDGTGFLTILEFASTNASFPESSLFYDGSFLYGTVHSGGTNSYGIIYKILPDGTGFTDLYDFAGNNGCFPQCTPISDGTYLYGIAGGGTFGIVFKVLVNGTGYTIMHTFVGPDGAYPVGGLFSDGTFLYGATNDGGTTNEGVLFKLDLATGIAETNTDSKISLFPNPNNGSFTIETASIVTIEITNAIGQVVMSKMINSGKNVIVLENDVNGVYFVSTIDTGGNKITQRIIIAQ